MKILEQTKTMTRREIIYEVDGKRHLISRPTSFSFEQIEKEIEEGIAKEKERDSVESSNDDSTQKFDDSTFERKNDDTPKARTNGTNANKKNSGKKSSLVEE